MKAAKQCIFKRLRADSSGNAMLFVALGMPVLIGAAGFAMDMAQSYAWKRELQHAVDQAALAGAWTLSYNTSSTEYSTRAQQEYAANLAVTSTFAQSNATVSLGNYGGTSANSVIVSARATKRLPFSGFLVNRAMTVFATAQATYAKGGTYQACLMALKKNSSKTFDVGGTANIVAKCGLGALSCNPEAISIGSNTTVDTDSIVTCGTANVPPGLQSKVTENAGGMANPFEDLPTPNTSNLTNKSTECPNGNAATDTTTIFSPGIYSGLNVNCKATLSKGIYVINGGVLDLTDNKTDVTGTGVMFVLKNGAQVKIGGSGNGGKVTLSPMEAADFEGTANEPYKNLYGGMLIYEEKGTQTSSVAHTFNGNANVSVRGTLYLPNGDLTINGNGNANPLCFQLWASTLTMSGTASITTTCTSENTNKAGYSTGVVRLVA